MKKIITALAVLFSVILNAQPLTLEHAYSASQIGLCQLSSGAKYYAFEITSPSSAYPATTMAINIYNLTHSVIKTTTMSFNAANGLPQLFPAFISDSLFNSDPSFEYLVRAPGSSSLMILAESGATLQTIPGSTSFGPYPVYTGTAWKAIVGGTVYALPGKLPLNKPKPKDPGNPGNPGNPSAVTEAAAPVLGSASPNPAQDITIIPYALPDGQTTGKVIVYDVQGHEVRSYNVGRAFNTLELTTSDLPAGTYFYSIVSGTHTDTKRLLIVH